MAAGPIQVGGPAPAPFASPTPVIPITISLPDVVVPEMTMPAVAPLANAPDMAPFPELPVAPVERMPAPEAVPAPAEAAREATAPETWVPGPYKPPLTPQPNPTIPQPPIIPETVPQPEREPMPSPVPAPMPQPSPMPQPQPMPQPVPQPEPGEPAPTASVGRALRDEELVSSRSTFWMYLIFGCVCGAIALILLRNPFSSFFKFIFLVGIGWLAYYLLRQALYRSAVRSVDIKPRRRLRLAEPLPLQAAVEVIREVGVSNVELMLVGEERAVKGSGKSATTHRHAFYTGSMRIPSPSSWPGGHEMLLNAVLPASSPAAPSSFAGRQNFIEWSATLSVGLTGLPDIRERITLTVLPARRAPALPNAHPVYRLPSIDPLNAQIGFTCPVSESNMPLFEAGRDVPFTLRMNPQGDFRQQRVFVELGYLVTGDGDHENATVARQSYPIAYWLDDPNREEHGVLSIPPSAPLTFDGAHLRIHWAITVRHEQPWGHDRRQIFEVQVVPACEN